MMAAKSSSGLPFPFGERDGEQDRRLFGEVVSARPAFKFETMASEFETAEDCWNDSGIGKLVFDRPVFSKSYLPENNYMI
jgi:hypothetical protein